MRFSQLRQYHDRIRRTPGVYDREALIRTLLDACIDAAERVHAAHLLLGRLALPMESYTAGIKESFIAKDLGLEGKQSLEDIAKIAMVRGETTDVPYDVSDIWALFRAYIEENDRSNAEKSRIVNVVLFDMAETKEDIPFLLQILCGKVSNGVDDKLILNAMLRPEGPETFAQAQKAFAFNPSLKFWIEQVYEATQPFFNVQPEPGIPMEPQLCARVDDIAKVLIEHRGMTLVQPKLDGMRVHIHGWGKARPVIRIFTREMKDITADYAEIVAAFAPLVQRCDRIVLDGELVALGEDGEIAPFSVLQKRLGRKTGHDAVKVGVVVYDILLLGSQSITTTPYSQRLAIIDKLLHGNTRLKVIASSHCASVEVLRNLLMESYQDGEEGLVCKDPACLPDPGARSKAWIKLKPSYMEEGGFGDSFDLVVIGYTKGRGKRHGKIGALWAGIRVDGIGPPRFYPVCKVGTGFTDEDLDWWTANLEGTDRRPDAIAKDIAEMPPDMEAWVHPEHVIEVKADLITPIDRWAGFSLRFPRLIRRRDDKSPSQATSTAEIQVP